MTRGRNWSPLGSPFDVLSVLPWVSSPPSRGRPLLTTTIRSPQVLAAYDWMVVLLEEIGFPGDRAMEVLTAAPDVMWEVPDGSRSRVSPRPSPRSATRRLRARPADDARRIESEGESSPH